MKQIVEVSWEVCNKVGGIYTVLSSRVPEMIAHHQRGNLLFVGPYIGHQADFSEHHTQQWDIESCPLIAHYGTWNIEGNPPVALIEFQSLKPLLNTCYYQMWQQYGIESDRGYGDYQQAALFSFAVAFFLHKHITTYRQALFLFNEWTTGLALLYLKHLEPHVQTLFLTHATTVGRSIAGNGKELYAYFSGYQGDQMAHELNVYAKHSVEKQAGLQATIFATVSSITARECKQFLGRNPVVLPNGFYQSIYADTEQGCNSYCCSSEFSFGSIFSKKRADTEVQPLISRLAETLYGTSFAQAPLLIATSGRYEFRNKGIDLFIEALKRLPSGRPIVALFLIPAWVAEPRKDLEQALTQTPSEALPWPFITHWLHNMKEDVLCHHLAQAVSHLVTHDVYPVFVPIYLSGTDPLLPFHYYALLSHLHLTVFPSYYEPWGYTPLESISYGVPTITSSLAGFGDTWLHTPQEVASIRQGIWVAKRTDQNFLQVAEEIAKAIEEVRVQTPQSWQKTSQSAKKKAFTMTWRRYYPHYLRAYQAGIVQEE